MSKRKKKPIENQILKKLRSMEKRIKTIELSLKRIDESSILTTEDQLFFTIAFSFLVLFLTLPDFDVSKVFENLGVAIEPSKGIITTKMVLIMLLILSSIFRYLTVLTKDVLKRNQWRMVSVSFLLSCFYFLVMDLFVRGLTSFLKSINVFLILIAPIGFSIIAVAVGFFIERKWYSHYGYTDGRATSSFIFALLGMTVAIAYYLAMITSLFIPISDVVAMVLLISSVFITALIIKLSNVLSKRLRQRSKKAENYLN